MPAEVEFRAQEPGKAPSTKDLLLGLLTSPETVSVHLGVAWVRSGGVKALRPGIETLLARDGTAMEMVVGVDIANTSQEGLELLLELKGMPGGERLRLDVYHEEGRRTTFHPKVFLAYETGDMATLVVGSANITAAAMQHNIEASLIVQSSKTDPVIQAARAALDGWKSRSGFAKELTTKFLEELIAERYVLDEATLRLRSAGLHPGKKRTKLFKGRPVPKGPPAGAGSPPPAGELDRVAVLIRIRMARGTQTQLPFSLLEDPFFDGVDELVAPDGTERVISEAHARGAVNTRKVEIPESKGISDPILLLSKDTSGRVHYECVDGKSARGAGLMHVLVAGLVSEPPETVATRKEIARATLYRVL